MPPAEGTSFLEHLRPREDWEIRQWKAFRREEAQELLARLPAKQGKVATLGAASVDSIASAFHGTAGCLHLASAMGEVKDLPNIVKVVGVDDALRICLPDKSQDILLTFYALEFLPMDRLYMVCREARRLLKEGGCWAMLSHHEGKNRSERWFSWLRGIFAGQISSLELTHYISPEDWDTQEEGFFRSNGITSQFLLLQRKSE